MDKFLKRIVWLVTAVPAVYLLLVWKKIPDQVALHFDLSGKADRFGHKKELLVTVLVLTAVSIFIYLLLTNIFRIDPKKYAAENKMRLQRLAFGVMVFITALLCMIISGSVNGNVSLNTGLVLAGVGLLFAFIGNYMYNIKPNYFAGFRLPWTLENEENWRRTHHLASKLWFAGGLLLAVICLFLTPKPAMVVFFTIMGIVTVIPVVYSYRLFRRQKSGASSGGNGSGKQVMND
jgi:uncharacterized membrane protein